MKARREPLEPFVDKWVIPLTKEYSDKKELTSLPVLGDIRLARLRNKQWVLVRKLTKDDLKDLDFVKYLTSINLPRFKSTIKTLHKLK